MGKNKINLKTTSIIFLSILWVVLWHLGFVKIGGRDNLKVFLASTFFSLSLLSIVLVLCINSSIILRTMGWVLAILVASFFAVIAGAFYYCSLINGPINNDILGALSQTHFREFFDFFSDGFISLRMKYISLGSGLIAFALLVVFYMLVRHVKLSMKQTVLSLLVLFFLAGFAFTEIRLVKRYQEFVTNYKAAIAEFRELSNAPEASIIKADKEGLGELHVIIIGESSSKHRMNLYGAAQDNTPWMSKVITERGWLKFTNAYSSHTHTVPSLLAALTKYNAYNSEDYFPNSPTLLQLSTSAGIDTAWISNQTEVSLYDNPISVLAKASDFCIFVNDSFGSQADEIPLDEIILPALDKHLATSDKSRNKLIIIHLIGSHSKYRYRYPKTEEYLRFYENKKLSSLGRYMNRSEKDIDRLLDYEASIAYTDYVLKEIFKRVSSYTQDPVTFTYISDHGEDPNNGGHNSSKFTWSMAHIPFVTWLSPAYIEKYPEKYINLKKNQDRIFTNDLLFDFYAGIANINFDGKVHRYDIGSSDYDLDETKAYLLLDSLFIRDDPWFIAKRNILNNLEQKTRLVMHRKNTLYGVADVRSLGGRGIEINVCYTNNKLIMGHDDRKLTGESLEEFLAHEAVHQMDFLWFDLKDLNSSNSVEILEKLEDLDQKYKLKNRSLLESSDPTCNKLFQKHGWDLSFYLPWSKIVSAAENPDLETNKVFIEDIIKQIESSGIKNLSFDIDAYDSVLKLIKPSFGDTLNYHGWSTAISIEDKDLGHKVLSFNELSTLVVKLKSDFHY